MRDGFYRRFGKRWLDVGLAGLALLVLSPLFLGLALAIWAIDGRPVLYHQERIGKQGKPFLLLKFRTMVPSAENLGSITAAGDPRITPLGKFLRRTKLDELPQLWNVFVGDMSLVGPRPEVPEYAQRLAQEAAEIFAVRPGITSPASLAFRNEEQLLAAVADPKKYNDEVLFPEKIRLNLQYVRSCSLRLDLELIVKTAFSLSRGPRPSGSVSGNTQ